MAASSSSTSFTMPLPKVPMDELFARVRESLAKMEKKEAEEKRRREALEERRWRKRRDKMINNKDKSPLFATWADASSAGELEESDEEELGPLEPLKADAVGSSNTVKEASPATDLSSAGAWPTSQVTTLAGAIAAAPKVIIPEEERIRRRKVELELIALSKKITEEKLRKEKMVPLVWNKPTFDPFSSGDTAADGNASDGASSSTSKGEQSPNPRKRRNDDDEGKKPYRNLRAIGVPPQARAYYARNESLYGAGGYTGFGVHRPTPEEIEDFVAFVDKWIPTDKKWRKKLEAGEEVTLADM
jgi:hypothetical protein